MAVTKIYGIKTTVDKAIEYICNPDKTDQKLYISLQITLKRNASSATAERLFHF